VVIIVLALAIIPDQHKPISEVFLETRNSTGLTGAGAAVYAFLIGLLMAQYTFTGYDASAHVSEETHNASRAAPQGIVMSVVVSLIAGFVLLFAVTWSIQDFTAERQSPTGFPPPFGRPGWRRADGWELASADPVGAVRAHRCC
jgi:amino acid transporter